MRLAMQLAKRIDFPSGYGVQLAGASRDQKEVFGEMFTALVMGIVLMYLVLVMQFGSFTAPLPVMLSLPLSLIGVVAALLATRGTLNLMSFIGIIMLMGLVTKNAILLVDFAQAALGRGVPLRQAILQAVDLRTRPILMTAAAAAVGMVPVAFEWAVGLERLSPLAVVAIGGLIAGTFLTLLIVPVLLFLLLKRRYPENPPPAREVTNTA